MRSSNNGNGRSRKGNAHCLFPRALFDAPPAFFRRPLAFYDLRTRRAHAPRTSAFCASKRPHFALNAPFASRRILLFERTARGDAGFFAPYAHMPARTSVRAGIKNPFFGGRIKPEAAGAPTRKDREDLFAGGQDLLVRLCARRAVKCAANRSGTARPHRRTTRTAPRRRSRAPNAPRKTPGAQNFPARAECAAKTRPRT